MSKVDIFLDECKKHVGEWVCSLHSTDGSNQPAAIFREAKKLGYQFEEVAPNRWGQKMYCEECGLATTHYKLLNIEPVFAIQERIPIDAKTRKRILQLFDERDAFTGAAISSVAEIDHKVPWTRLDEDIDAKKLTNEEIVQHFQLLTREHNLLKDRACDKCKTTNIRPPFLEISYWYSGTEEYQGTCEGCGWYDTKKWRSEINKLIKKIAKGFPKDYNPII